MRDSYLFGRNFGGTGLGLWISKSIIKLCGGEIRVDSKLGKGSNFLFAIPISFSQEEIDKTKMERLIKQLEWFNNFADYLESNNINMYNESCDYADNKERYEIF